MSNSCDMRLPLSCPGLGAPTRTWIEAPQNRGHHRAGKLPDLFSPSSIGALCGETLTRHQHRLEMIVPALFMRDITTEKLVFPVRQGDERIHVCIASGVGANNDRVGRVRRRRSEVLGGDKRGGAERRRRVEGLEGRIRREAPPGNP